MSTSVLKMPEKGVKSILQNFLDIYSRSLRMWWILDLSLLKGMVMKVTDEKLLRLKSEIQGKLSKRNIAVEIHSRAIRENTSLCEIRVSGTTVNGKSAESTIIFYSDTYLVKFAAGNNDVCEWIANNYLKKPNYDMFNFLSAYSSRR
ncbi:hypothetical protein MCERE19_01428 [Spirosomataceae bacterium]|jgi:hypothetical protein